MAKHIITPLMRLQDADMTHVVIVTLPEVTPVSQAAALQEDLRRAHIEPWAWVINKAWLPRALLIRCCKPAWRASGSSASA